MSHFWMYVYGGSTHFPIALLFSSMLFDLIGYSAHPKPVGRDLHTAAFFALLLGAHWRRSPPSCPG